jgi:hypothetical protein
VTSLNRGTGVIHSLAKRGLSELGVTDGRLSLAAAAVNVDGTKALVLCIGSGAPVLVQPRADNVFTLTGHNGRQTRRHGGMHPAVDLRVSGRVGEDLVFAGAVVGLLHEVAEMEGHLGSWREKKLGGGIWVPPKV